MNMRKLAALILLSGLLFLGLDVSDANLMADVTFNNDTGSAITETPQRFPLSTQGLLNGSVIQSDTLDMALLNTSDDEVPMMPSPVNTEMQECRLDDGGAFQNEDSDCNDPGAGDEVSLLPATPVAGDAFYFGGHWPFRILRIQMDTAHSATGDALDLTWEYCTAANCSSATAVSNIADGTGDFRNSGTNTVSFDMPTDWTAVSVDGDTSYWLRARVSTAPTGTIVQPLAVQVWWERGVAETLLCDVCGTDTALTALTLNDNTSKQYSLFTGQSADLTHHLYYPGSAGFTVPDNGLLEPNLDNLLITFSDIYINTDSTGSERHLLNKGNQFEIAQTTTSGEIEVDIRDDPSTSGACNLNATGVATGQHDITVSIVKGTNCTIIIDGVIEDTDNDVSGQTENNANDWVFLENNSAEYVGQVNINVDGGAVEATYRLNDTFTGTTLPNRMNPGTHDATPTFNLPAANIGTVAAFESVQAVEGEASQAGSPDIVGDQFSDTPEFAGTPVSGSSLPGGGAVDEMADAANLPASSFWLMLGFVVAIGTLAFSFKATQNVVFSMLLSGVAMMIFSTMGFFEVWQVFVFAVVGAAIVLIGARFTLNA